jgi:hypothetical protein
VRLSAARCSAALSPHVCEIGAAPVQHKAVEEADRARCHRRLQVPRPLRLNETKVEPTQSKYLSGDILVSVREGGLLRVSAVTMSS